MKLPCAMPYTCTAGLPDGRLCMQDPLVSRISRKSIDLLKLHFREQMGQDDWRLVIKLKKILGVD